MENVLPNPTENKPSLIAHYRPIGLKAVVAATSVKGKVLEEKQPEKLRTPVSVLDTPFSD